MAADTSHKQCLSNNDITCLVAIVILLLPLWGPLTHALLSCFMMAYSLYPLPLSPVTHTLHHSAHSMQVGFKTEHMAKAFPLALTSNVTLPLPSSFLNPSAASTFLWIWHRCNIIILDDPFIQSSHFRDDEMISL